MSNIVPMQQPRNGFLMQPETLDQAMRLAEMLSGSNLVPKAYQGKPADVLVACQWGAEIGLQPLQALQNIAVINNIPAVWGDAVVALVRASGQCEYIKQEYDDATRTATCRVKRKGQPEEVRTFSYEDANLAGHLNKQTYKANLKRMLSVRARAFALRDVFADVLKGLKVAEEVEDYAEEREINPAPAPQAKPVSRAAAVLDKVRKHTPEPVIEQQPEPAAMDDATLAQLNDLIGMLAQSESLNELNDVAQQIHALGQLPADIKAKASDAYRVNNARIKAAMAAE